ncbi:hypothetical protein DXA21_21470 [Parabacteroides distasonis]|nr:hypothetical protein DXA21_21470 [Parabacteroides distasonis]
MKQFVYEDGKWVPTHDDEFGLKQFVYEDGKWVPTHDDEFISATKTDKDGGYIFDNLDTHKKDNGVNKLYGYEVWVVKGPDGYAVTRYGDDSYLLVSGHILKADSSLNEILDGKTCKWTHIKGRFKLK